MKMNKKQAGLIAGLVCVVLLFLLLLTMCGRGEDVSQTEPAETTPTVVETTEETEAATEETEEATEETTEATEETTEPTEEATEPVTGNDRPGGTSGYNPGTNNGGVDSDDTNQPVTETAPAAGSEGSPYLEIVTQFPDSFNTVSIPTGSTVYQSIIGAGNSVLTIEDADAYVVYDGTTYEPDDNGIVTVALAAAETENAPVVIQVGNKNAEDKAFALNFQASLGSAGNPEPITAQEGVIAIKASLAAGDEDGYFYQYVAEENSKLTLTVDKITEDTACDIVITVDETVVKLSESEDGSVSVDLKQEDIAVIQVIAIPAEDATYPAAEIEISGTVESAPGTSANPIVVFGEFPIVTDTIEPGASLFYSVYGANAMTLQVADADACITIDGVTYAPVDGVISALITAADLRTPVSIVVGNSGEEAKSFTIELIPPVGTMGNPEPMVEGENTASIEEGDADGYWFSWTAENDAVITITMPEGHWMYSVTHVSGDTSTTGDNQWSDSDPVVSSYEVKVAYGDVVNVMVSTYDPENPWTAPAGDVTVTLSVVQHVDVGYAGATLELDPGETVFCKAVLRAKSIILKVAGEDSFTVNLDGKDYTSVNGLVTIEGVESEFFNPKQFTITNNSDAAQSYSVSYENPVGSSANPNVIEEMGEYTCGINGDGEGYFFQWIAAADGELTFTVTSDDWVYTINNQTSYQYGSNHISTAGDSPTETITVKAGDRIQINLGTASYEKKDVTFEVSFQPAEQPPEGDASEETAEDTAGEDTTTDDSTEEDTSPENSTEEDSTTEASAAEEDAENTSTEWDNVSADNSNENATDASTESDSNEEVSGDAESE